MNNTLDLYYRFHQETGDPVAASNLTLAHAMLAGQERQQEQALTVAEAAQRLKVSEKKVYRLCEEGLLDHHRVFHSIRITPTDLDRFIRQSAEESRSREARLGQRILSV